MQCRDYRDAIMRRNKEDCIREMTQQRTSRLSSNLLEPKRLKFDVRDATGYLRDEAIAQSGLLSFVPGVGIADVRLRLRPDYQAHVRPA